MRKILLLATAGVAVYGAASWWRANRRAGASFVNRIVDPWLERRGFISGSHGELGLVEHVGRKSGTLRRTPIHPMPIPGGFRIIVPIGERSEWARNVLAAGQLPACRRRAADPARRPDPRNAGPGPWPSAPGARSVRVAGLPVSASANDGGAELSGRSAQPRANGARSAGGGGVAAAEELLPVERAPRQRSLRARDHFVVDGSVGLELPRVTRRPRRTSHAPPVDRSGSSRLTSWSATRSASGHVSDRAAERAEARRPPRRDRCAG